MVKFKSFKAEDEKEINEFLAENWENISSNSIAYTNDRICFIVTTLSEAEREKNNIISGIKNQLTKLKVDLAQRFANISFQRGLVLMGGGDLQLKKEEEAKDAILKQIYYTTQVMYNVQKDEFLKEIPDPFDVKVGEENIKSLGLEKKEDGDNKSEEGR